MLVCLSMGFIVLKMKPLRRKKNVWNTNGDISGSIVLILICFYIVHNESNSVI